MIPKVSFTVVGNLGYKPKNHHHKHHLQHGLKQQTLSIKNTQQDLTSGIKRFRHQGYAGFKGGFLGFSKQLLLTKHLSPYCQVISSSLIRLTYLLGFCSSSLYQIKYYFSIMGITRANLSTSIIYINLLSKTFFHQYHSSHP